MNRRRINHLGPVLVALALLAAACGGASGGGGTGGGSAGGTDSGAKKAGDLKLTAEDGESGLAKAGKAKRGGKLVYALEAESSDGFCLSDAQLAISGMMVVRAIYDTLTVPNAAGGYSPYLAKAVTPNKDFTEWTITLRSGIKFHDGTKLDAQVVKNNIDAYRGTYPGRSSLLFAFVLKNIADTSVAGPLAVKVTTKKPWVSFPAFLYSSSRMGMMAQAQLDDPKSCNRKLIGTGPFKFVSWTPNQKLVAKANPDYWQIAPDGKPYPYVDSIEFRPIPDPLVANQALQAGDINIMHTSTSEYIAGFWVKQRDAGKANLLVSGVATEPSFIQLNETLPPFDDLSMRQAFASALDRTEMNRILGSSLPVLAQGPFAPDSIGFVKDTGFPTFDLARAKKLIAAYRAKGKNPDFTYTTTNDAPSLRAAQLVQQLVKAAGVNMKILTRDQAAQINDAIGKKYQAMDFRNYPGGDPDLNYVWWFSGETGADGKFAPNPVNFSGINDPEVDRLLTEGRSEPDAAKRKAIYRDLERRMAGQVHGLWRWFTPWAIAEASNVHDILGPPLPGVDASKPAAASTDDQTRQPSKGLATGHSLLGLWIDQN